MAGAFGYARGESVYSLRSNGESSGIVSKIQNEPG